MNFLPESHLALGLPPSLSVKKYMVKQRVVLLFFCFLSRESLSDTQTTGPVRHEWGV